jgi:hypothetical protein
VKNEAGEVVETSGLRYVINPQASKEFQKWPWKPKWSAKMGAQNFLNFHNFEIL